jgi:glycosyltransferase involved in cell wall biosynthesis
MKILNILFNYKKSTHDNQILGVERCFIDYARYLISSGNEVISVIKSNMFYRDEIKKVGSKLLELPAFNQGDIFSILRLTFSLIFLKPNVIICHSGRALSFARSARLLSFKKIPIIAIDHGVNPEKFMKADYILAVNSYFSNQLIKAGKPANYCMTIPNMIEVPKDFSPLVKKSFRKPIKLGSLGRLYAEKNFDKVLKAMTFLRDWGIECEYVIGGVGPMEKPLNNLAKELNLEKNFKILGWTTEKREFFDEIDIFILPSLGETFGIVLLEAMLYSTPIITSNSWGPDEIILEEIDGLKVSKDDENAMPEILAKAIKKLIDDENFAKNLSKNAYEKLFNFYTAEIVIKKLNQICDIVANGGNFSQIKNSK